MKSDIDALMKEKKLDALLVLGAAEHNPPMYFFTGGGHISEAVLVKKFGEDPILFYNEMERDEAAKTGLQTRSKSIYSYQELLKEAGGDVTMVEVLRFQHMLTDIGLTKGRVAIYGNKDIGSAYGLMTKLQGIMPDLQIIGE